MVSSLQLSCFRFILKFADLCIAGIPLKEAKGSKTSVHTGSFSSDWAALQLKDPQNASKYAGTGMAHSLLANRISWFFDFKGPSFALDSACSSSMMALDLACQGLQTGQSTMVSSDGESWKLPTLVTGGKGSCRWLQFDLRSSNNVLVGKHGFPLAR